MEKSVEFWISDEGGCFNGGFRNYEFLNEFLYAKLSSYEASHMSSSKENYELLINHIKGAGRYPPDEIFRLFLDDLYIDFELCVKLNRFDIIEISVFKHKTELGRIIKKLIESSGIMFVVNWKRWCSESEIYIDLEATLEENVVSCISKINLRKNVR